MEFDEPAPIGYTDLSADEAFIVTLYRHWQMIGPTRLAAERTLSLQLRKDRLYDAFAALFAIFKEIPTEPGYVERNDSNVLRPAEEMLLELIGSDQYRLPTKVEGLQRYLSSAKVGIRPASEIPRTGRDRLVEQVGWSSMLTQGWLHANC